MSSKHQAILELDLMEGCFYLPILVEYTYFPRVPASGPSWASGGEPEEPAMVEIDGVDSADDGKPLPDWMLELAWQYLHEYRLDDLLEIAKAEEGWDE